MVFSSLVFICIFLPCVFILYAIIPVKWVRIAILTVASVVFYAYGEPVYVLLLLGSWIFNYFIALWISKSEKAKAKILIIVCAIVNIGLLVVFKYTNFILENLSLIPWLKAGLSGVRLSAAMPIGISFYTFQTLSYVIDVYRGNVAVQKNAVKLLFYISFFPQLIAGPIVKYRDIAIEIDERRLDFSETFEGLRRFIFGLGKKVLLADVFASAADKIFGAEASLVNLPVAWLAAICYMLQIYFDFSGYSDMAIGMGRMFGFHFKENFNYPYIACGIKDFWKRWHISLTDWFREYEYIPMGGNRGTRLETSLHKVIIFLLTGLWHGANWTFVAWGLFHVIFQLLEDFLPIRKLPKAVLHVYTVIVVCVGFVMFRADSLTDGALMISRMFGGWFSSPDAAVFLKGFMTPWFITILVVGILAVGIIQSVVRMLEKKAALQGFKKVSQVAATVLAVGVLLLCMMQLAGSTYHPFIYFRF